MKYIILIGDGMADYPVDKLNGRTPLESACTPNMDRLARMGTLGLVNTIPEGFPPGSDVANLSILGYDPRIYYTGRSPLEAASIGVELDEEDLTFRCNLVYIQEEDDRVLMADYSADHITTKEAREIIIELDRRLSGEGVRFYPGVGYRHLMVWRGGPDGIKTTPPHDISGRDIRNFLPRGNGAERLARVMELARDILNEHPVNLKRKNSGRKPANSIWLWGGGRAPEMPTIKERFGIDGAIISAVDLMKGIGIYAGLEVIDVPGATGYIDTNYKAKVEYALKAAGGTDMVLVHIEAPDEAGHKGNLEDKIRSIEDFDLKIVKGIMDKMEGGQEYRVLILCDHPTPLSIRTHTNDPVPFIIYPPVERERKSDLSYNERSARKSGIFIADGYKLMELFLGRTKPYPYN